ncbi:MAG: hypothetical protein Q8J68_12055 [Methanolobus sp.]|uniref:hypothetical protein n=1 Tax=Methanolobus sp. TaxID=1874737 RepID=UPI0027305169|nr:hypothetical protein [Methanolobus sp.]MDP2218006.1 hypothetical protein [Methanolobus sp.]
MLLLMSTAGAISNVTISPEEPFVGDEVTITGHGDPDKMTVVAVIPAFNEEIAIGSALLDAIPGGYVHGI